MGEDMEILQAPITVSILTEQYQNNFSDMIKGVVDIERGLLAIDAELHSDLESLLLDAGSRQEALWGINLYPEEEGEDLVEFDSLINIRPGQGNRSRGVSDPKIQQRIWDVVNKWILQ